jgi:hypothetical protein
MKWEEDHFILSTGREVYAICNVVGINERLELSYGYDGFIDEFGNIDDWTSAERTELADHMIGLWKQFKERK